MCDKCSVYKDADFDGCNGHEDYCLCDNCFYDEESEIRENRTVEMWNALENGDLNYLQQMMMT